MVAGGVEAAADGGCRLRRYPRCRALQLLADVGQQRVQEADVDAALADQDDDQRAVVVVEHGAAAAARERCKVAAEEGRGRAPVVHARQAHVFAKRHHLIVAVNCIYSAPLRYQQPQAAAIETPHGYARGNPGCLSIVTPSRSS